MRLIITLIVILSISLLTVRSTFTMPSRLTRYGRVDFKCIWIPLICWKLKIYCWKYCSKIILKWQNTVSETCFRFSLHGWSMNSSPPKRKTCKPQLMNSSPPKRANRSSQTHALTNNNHNANESYPVWFWEKQFSVNAIVFLVFYFILYQVCYIFLLFLFFFSFFPSIK